MVASTAGTGVLLARATSPDTEKPPCAEMCTMPSRAVTVNGCSPPLYAALGVGVAVKLIGDEVPAAPTAMKFRENKTDPSGRVSGVPF